MRFLKYLLLCFSIMVLGCEEETIEPDLFGTLAGKVIDDATGLPVANAEISSNPATAPYSSAADGTFDFGEVKTGTYTIRAEKNGYTLNVETVLVEEGKRTEVTIRLKDDSFNNRPPDQPINVLPVNNALNQPVNTVFKWRKTKDPNTNDEVKYSLLIYPANAGTTDTLIHQTMDTAFIATNLLYNTEYLWQILAYDASTVPVFGPVWRFKTVAPPDNRILFARKTNNKYDIWSTNITGTTQVQLSNSGSNNWRPHYSPNRQKIAYLSDQNIDAQIFVMNADGTDATQITTLSVAGYNTIDLDFCWSPNGAQLLYMHNSRLYRVDADGTGLALFAEAPAGFTFSEVDWNGQSKTIAARVTGVFIYESKILEYNESGALLSTIVPDQTGSIGGGMYFPDGSRLLYSQDEPGVNFADGRQLDARLKIKNLNTMIVSDFSANKIAGTNDLDARYSPDAAKIIFVNTDNDGISTRSIWTVEVGNLFTRTKIADNAEMPDWR